MEVDRIKSIYQNFVYFFNINPLKMNSIHNEMIMSDPQYSILYSKMTVAIINFNKEKDINEL